MSQPNYSTTAAQSNNVNSMNQSSPPSKKKNKSIWLRLIKFCFTSGKETIGFDSDSEVEVEMDINLETDVNVDPQDFSGMYSELRNMTNVDGDMDATADGEATENEVYDEQV